MSAQPLVPPGPTGPTGPVGPHLGERVSTFVDDALPPDARDRALVHIAGCERCHSQVEAARLLKARLAALPAPQVPVGLTARLLSMAEPGGPIPPRPSQLPTQPRAISVATRPTASRPRGSRPSDGNPLGSRPAGRSQRVAARDPRRTVRLAALAGAALSTMVVAVVGLSSGVGSESRTPPLTQLTSNVSTTGIPSLSSGSSNAVDPMVDVSRVIRDVTDKRRPVTKR